MKCHAYLHIFMSPVIFMDTNCIVDFPGPLAAETSYDPNAAFTSKNHIHPMIMPAILSNGLTLFP